MSPVRTLELNNSYDVIINNNDIYEHDNNNEGVLTG